MQHEQPNRSDRRSRVAPERARRKYRATLCVVMPFRTLCVFFATQSVESFIPTLERRERSSQLACDAPRWSCFSGDFPPPRISPRSANRLG
ncbi:hypothetical protein DND58_06050 [Pseudomonas syringae pv. pisi]|nr:hypothetical protein DND62_01785 [Pseudomonas syringae pv. pisi]PYD32927.1 hypothetical protein DND58_06050 [Pseudomonas syringae pv. pisi]